MHRTSGIALVMSLLLIVILVVLVGQLSYSVKIDSFIAENETSEVQIQYALLSATNYAIAQLQLDTLKEESTKENWDAYTDEWGTPLWTHSKPYQMGKVSVFYNISDENERFNLTTLIKKQPKKDEKDKKDDKDKNDDKDENNDKDKNNENNNSNNNGENKDDDNPDQPEEPKEPMTPSDHFKRLMKVLLKKNETINIDALESSMKHWMEKKESNSDEIVGPFPTKVPLYSVKELIMAKDIKNDYIFGYIDPKDEKKSFVGLWLYTTVWSDGAININTASKELLCSLHSKISDKLSDFIIYHRRTEGEDKKIQIFKKPDDLKNIKQIDERTSRIFSDITPIITTKSSYFRIEAYANSGRLHKKLTTIVYRQGRKIFKIFCDYE